MKKDLAASLLAVVGGAVALMAPHTSSAANVGFYLGTSSCISPASSIIAAGHTPVPVTSLDAPTLAPLRALIIASCGNYAGDPDVDAAVANGMALVIDTPQNGFSSAQLPGTPSFTLNFSCPINIDLASGAPIASGPGGTLTNASFDFNSGACALVGAVVATQLPTGSVPFLIPASTGNVGAFGYRHGQGSVAASFSQFSFSGVEQMSWFPASRSYFSNSLTWAIQDSNRFTSCAAEGFTGVRLTMCQQICEIPQSPLRLNTWIKMYLTAYREDPPCAN